jgi:hypothetical protein
MQRHDSQQPTTALRAAQIVVRIEHTRERGEEREALGGRRGRTVLATVQEGLDAGAGSDAFRKLVVGTERPRGISGVWRRTSTVGRAAVQCRTAQQPRAACTHGPAHRGRGTAQAADTVVVGESGAPAERWC